MPNNNFMVTRDRNWTYRVVDLRQRLWLACTSDYNAHLRARMLRAGDRRVHDYIGWVPLPGEHPPLRSQETLRAAEYALVDFGATVDRVERALRGMEYVQAPQYTNYPIWQEVTVT